MIGFDDSVERIDKPVLALVITELSQPCSLGNSTTPIAMAFSCIKMFGLYVVDAAPKIVTASPAVIADATVLNCGLVASNTAAADKVTVMSLPTADAARVTVETNGTAAQIRTNY